MKSFSLIAAAALAAAPLAAGATALADGSFEAKGAATPVTNYCYDFGATPGGPACAASPWTGNGVIITGSGAWGGTIAEDGIYYAFVQGGGVLSQTFTATSTSGLAVNWFDANRTNNGGIQSYTVTVTHGSDVFNLGTFSGVPGQFNPQTSSSFSTVAGDNYTLSFSGVFTDDRTAFIDNVSLSVVPEPAMWGLMLAGFGLIGIAARRRPVALSA